MLEAAFKFQGKPAKILPPPLLATCVQHPTPSSMALEGASSGLARAISEGLAKGQTGDYEAKAILLTGGAGFIASHVAIRLVSTYPNTKARPRSGVSWLGCRQQARVEWSTCHACPVP